MTSRSEPELVEIRKAAEALAKDRGERFSTAHVLAALAGRPGDVAQLLADRRLDQDTLLRAARVASDTTPDALAHKKVNYPLFGLGYVSGVNKWRFGIELLYIASETAQDIQGSIVEYWFGASYNF